RRFRDHHRLSNVVLRQLPRHRTSVFNISVFLRTRSPLREHARFRQQRFQQRGRILKHDALTRQNLRDRAQQRVRIACPEREQQLRQPPVRLDGGKNLLVLYLPRHDGASDTLGFKRIDKLRQFAQRKPMHGGSAVRFNLGSSLFANRRHDHLKPLRPRRVQHQKRKLPIASDEAEFLSTTHYLITPRSDASMNPISIATSSPRSASDFSFSIACEVFSFEASSTLYA